MVLLLMKWWEKYDKGDERSAERKYLEDNNIICVKMKLYVRYVKKKKKNIIYIHNQSGQGRAKAKSIYVWSPL